MTPTYRGTSLQLNATDKDGQAWRNYLLSRGVAADKIVWLTEATIAPTEAKILSEIDALVAPQAPTEPSQVEYLVFFYAGHGTRTQTQTVEADGLDECIVTSDNRIIRDDVLRARLIDALAPNQRLLAVFDCCHASTILDLDIIVEYDPKNDSLVKKPSGETLAFSQTVVTPQPLAPMSPAILAVPALGIAAARAQSQTTSMLLMAVAAVVAMVLQAQRRRPPLVTTVPVEPRTGQATSVQAMCLSACRDEQYAYESVSNGFFTAALLAELN